MRFMSKKNHEPLKLENQTFILQIKTDIRESTVKEGLLINRRKEWQLAL